MELPIWESLGKCWWKSLNQPMKEWRIYTTKSVLAKMQLTTDDKSKKGFQTLGVLWEKWGMRCEPP